MKIDNENKVVWCSEAEMEWYVSFNVSAGNTMICDMKRIAHLSTEKEMVMRFNVDLKTRLQMINAITEGYEFKVKEQKYYWRKKEKYSVWFEVVEDTYLAQDEDDGELTLGLLDGAGWKCKFTTQEARDLLKDDFDKFEKVECE